MAKTAQTSVQPVEVASAAGARRSSWMKYGDGPWSGTVVRKDGVKLTVEEQLLKTRTSWKVTDETGKSTTGVDLAVALRKAGV